MSAVGHWTLAEIAILRAARAHETSLAVEHRMRAAGFVRTQKAIRMKRLQLKLPQPRGGRRDDTAWTPDEDAIILSQPGALATQLAAMMVEAGYTRTPQSCYARIRHLLKGRPRPAPRDTLAPHVRDARGYPWFQLTGWPADSRMAGLARRYS